MRKAKCIYVELTVARESATIACILTDIQRQARSGKALQWQKGRLLVCPNWKLLAGGSCKQAN